MADTHPGATRIFVILVVYLLLAAPLAYFIWGGLSHLLAGPWNPAEFGIGLGSLALFVVLVTMFRRWLDTLPTD
jgi:hypothetical protein